MTKDDAKNFIKNNGKKLFKKYKKLNLLGVYLIDADKEEFGIEANINITSSIESSLMEDIVSDLKNMFKKDISEEKLRDDIEISKSTEFKTINGTGKTSVSANDTIHNIHNPDYNGRLGAVFTVNKYKDSFMLTNQHVIGRLIMHSSFKLEIIRRKKPLSNEYEDIGYYVGGDITKNSDFAIAKFNSDIETKIPSTKPVIIESRELLNENLKIFNKSNNNVKIDYAMVRIHDKYFYKGGIILKDQMVINKRFQPGTSGAAAILDGTNTKFVGLLVAVNSSYTIVNKSENIFNDITTHVTEFLGLKIKHFKILNHYN